MSVNLETMTHDELLAYAQNLGKSTVGGFKVTEKGGISRYGLGRFPATFYLSQWEAIIADVVSGRLQSFIEANRPLLATKPVKA